MKRRLLLAVCGFALCVESSCGGGAPLQPTQPAAPDTVNLTPTGMNFGGQSIGTNSSQQIETITNSGGSTLAISAVAISGGNAADFVEKNTCGSLLAPNASCTVSISFTPNQSGPRAASLTINDDGLDSPQSVSLNGTGEAAGPNASLSAASLDFGSQRVNTSTSLSLTVSDFGNNALNISSITSSTDFSETDDCVPSLAPAANCTINVTFTPSTTGNLSGTLSLFDDASDSPQGVVLSGTGTSGGMCVAKGGQCYPGHPCCSGLQCQPASTRAFCE